MHDIPQGAFISVYVGNLYSSEEANKQGQNFGDEYFAELDMIEVIERRKDGYESDVSDEGFNDEEENNKETAPGASKHSSKHYKISTGSDCLCNISRACAATIL